MGKELFGAEFDTLQMPVVRFYGVLARLKYKSQKLGKASLTSEEKALVLKLGAAIKSGQGTGKTFVCAFLAIWMLLCFPESAVAITSPREETTRTGIWREFDHLLSMADVVFAKFEQPNLLRNLILVQAKEVKRLGAPRCKIILKTVNTGATAEEQGDSLRGFHSPQCLVITDETPGLSDSVLTVYQGTLSSPGINLMLMVGNPTKKTGLFIEAFKSWVKYWYPCTWNAELSAHVSQEQLQMKLDMYGGRETNLYRINVLGEPPITDSTMPFDWDDFQAAFDLNFKQNDLEEIVMTLDSASGGKDYVHLAVWSGMKLLTMARFRPTNKQYALQEISRFVSPYITRFKVSTLVIDDNGGGRFLGNYLQRLGLNVVFCMGHMKAIDSDHFMTLTDEIRDKLRLNLEAKALDLSALNSLVELKDHLLKTATKITVSYPNGRCKYESNDSLKKRGVESPDGLDCLALREFISHEIRLSRHGAEEMDEFRRSIYERRNPHDGVDFMGA